MNKIYSFCILISLLFGLVFQRQQIIFKALLALPDNVFQLCLSLVLTACLFNGFLEIAKASGLISRLSHLIMPLFKKIYPDLSSDPETIGLIASNFIANFIGLGGLALVSGLEAMRALDKLNPNPTKPSHAMKTLIIFNTTGCSLLSLTVMSLRAKFQAQDASGFTVYTLLIGVVVLAIGLLIQKGIEKHGS